MATLKVKRGDTWIFTAKWRDSAGAPIDLDGCSVRQNLTVKGDTTAVLEASTVGGEITIVNYTALGTVATLDDLPASPSLSDIYTVTGESASYIYTSSGWVVLADTVLCNVYTRVEAAVMAELEPGCYEFDQEVTFTDDRVLSTETIRLTVVEDKTL